MGELLKDLFPGKPRVIIGMVHLDALPGTPLNDADGGMARIVENARAGRHPFQG